MLIKGPGKGGERLGDHQVSSYSCTYTQQEGNHLTEHPRDRGGGGVM